MFIFGTLFFFYQLVISILGNSFIQIPKRETSSSSFLYADALNLLTRRHRSRLTLSRAQLQALVIPALRTEFVQQLLAVAVSRRSILAAAMP